MAAIRVHGALAVEQPAAEGKQRVHQGDGQRQQRHGKGDNGIELEQAQHGHGGKHIAQQQCAGVAHENLGGVEVIGDEADTAAHQRGQDHGDIALGHGHGNHQHGNGADGGNAAGKAVQPVDQVHGVGDAYDPDHGDGDPQPVQEQILIAAEQEGTGKGLDDNAVVHGDKRGQELEAKLDPGIQGDHIVNGADDNDQYRAKQNALYLAVNVGKQNDRNNKAEEDGQTAHAGDGVVMHPACLAGDIHSAHLLGKEFYDRGGSKADNKGDTQRDQQLHPKMRSSYHNDSPNVYLAIKPSFLCTLRRVRQAVWEAFSAPAR